MTKEQLLNRINDIDNELSELTSQRIYGGKKFNSLLKEQKELSIKYNQLCNYYYHEDKWIYELAQSVIQTEVDRKLVGNELTKAVAMKLNELDGIVLEEEFNEETNTLNYVIEVVTPYTIYTYRLNRGYGPNCNLYKDELCGAADKNGYRTNKSKANILVPREHICELVYKCSLKELKEEFGHKILDKPLNKESDNTVKVMNCHDALEQFMREYAD